MAARRLNDIAPSPEALPDCTRGLKRQLRLLPAVIQMRLTSGERMTICTRCKLEVASVSRRSSMQQRAFRLLAVFNNDHFECPSLDGPSQNTHTQQPTVESLASPWCCVPARLGTTSPRGRRRSVIKATVVMVTTNFKVPKAVKIELNDISSCGLRHVHHTHNAYLHALHARIHITC
eukprot:2514623-Pleurochrysis_carterae.AAC.1